MIPTPTEVSHQDEYATKPINKDFFSYVTHSKAMSVIICPKCKSPRASLLVIKQENILMLKTRSWISCKSCGFNSTTSNLKKELNCK